MAKRAIGVIGQGFVGGSLSVGMCHAFDVYAYDKACRVVDSQGRGNIYNGSMSVGVPRAPIELREFVTGLENGGRCGGILGHTRDFAGVYFIGVPTPMYEDGEADVSIVESVLDELASVEGERIAVVKSTVPPGTTMGWNEKYKDTGLTVVFNPEFLTEANAIQDFLNQNRIILGGPRPQINVVKQLFQAAYPNVPIIKTSSTTAEMVKYVTNCFLATKVSLANEFYEICNALDSAGLDIDYDKVIEYAKYDQRLGQSHWAVPGPVVVDGKHVRGFGGHCIIPGTQVLLDDCSLEKECVEQIMPGMSIVSCDHELSITENKIVDKTSGRLYDGDVLTFDLGDQRVTCTPEHILPVKRGGAIVLLEACYIRDDDELFVIE